jgi:hypothetical protein
MMARADALYLHYSGTWCQIFKTEKYLKHKKIADRLDQRIVDLAFKESGVKSRCKVKVHGLHKWSYYNTSMRVNYRYLIEVNQIKG